MCSGNNHSSSYSVKSIYLYKYSHQNKHIYTNLCTCLLVHEYRAKISAFPWSDVLKEMKPAEKSLLLSNRIAPFFLECVFKSVFRDVKHGLGFASGGFPAFYQVVSHEVWSAKHYFTRSHVSLVSFPTLVSSNSPSCDEFIDFSLKTAPLVERSRLHWTKAFALLFLWTTLKNHLKKITNWEKTKNRKKNLTQTSVCCPKTTEGFLKSAWILYKLLHVMWWGVSSSLMASAEKETVFISLPWIQNMIWFILLVISYTLKIYSINNKYPVTGVLTEGETSASRAWRLFFPKCLQHAVLLLLLLLF